MKRLRYFFSPRAERTSAAPSKAAVTTSCLGVSLDAPFAASNTNWGSAPSEAGGGGGGRRLNISGMRLAIARTIATAAQISEAATGPRSGSVQ